MTKAKEPPKNINTDFDGDQSPEMIAAAFKRGTELGLEPELRGDTTFGLNVEWINWYCRVNNTAVWKARKAGKRKLARLQRSSNK